MPSGGRKSSVSKLAGYEKPLQGVDVRKLKNACIKVVKVSRTRNRIFILQKNC